MSGHTGYYNGSFYGGVGVPCPGAQQKVRCYCVSEEPQGVRPGPNAPTHEVAERDYPCCGGTGLVLAGDLLLFEHARIAAEWWNGQHWYSLTTQQKQTAWMEVVG